MASAETFSQPASTTSQEQSGNSTSVGTEHIHISSQNSYLDTTHHPETLESNLGLQEAAKRLGAEALGETVEKKASVADDSDDKNVPTTEPSETEPNPPDTEVGDSSGGEEPPSPPESSPEAPKDPEEDELAFAKGQPARVHRSDGSVEEGLNPLTKDGWFAGETKVIDGVTHVVVRKRDGLDDEGKDVFLVKEVPVDQLKEWQEETDDTDYDGPNIPGMAENSPRPEDTPPTDKTKSSPVFVGQRVRVQHQNGVIDGGTNTDHWHIADLFEKDGEEYVRVSRAGSESLDISKESLVALQLENGQQGHTKAQIEAMTSLGRDRVVNLLSYNDTLGKDEASINANLNRTLALPNIERYIESINELSKKYGNEAVLAQAKALRDKCVAELTSMGIKPSEYAGSMSWAMWDIAKQFHMLNHPEDTSDKYKRSLADPMEESRKGELKRDEIVSRHIGWEAQGERERLFGLSPEAKDILAKLDVGGVDELSSYDLSRLGEELTRSFRITGKGYAKPEVVLAPSPVPIEATKSESPKGIVAMYLNKARDTKKAVRNKVKAAR